MKSNNKKKLPNEPSVGNGTKPHVGGSLWPEPLFTAAGLTEARLKIIQTKKLNREEVDCEAEFISLINLFNRLWPQ